MTTFMSGFNIENFTGPTKNRFCRFCGEKLKKVKVPYGFWNKNKNIDFKPYYNEISGKKDIRIQYKCTNEECRKGKENLCPFLEKNLSHQYKYFLGIFGGGQCVCGARKIGDFI